MKIGYVAATVWNNRQHQDLDGRKLLLVRRVNSALEPVDDYAVCIDAVGVGEGEWVITVAGSSARLTQTTEHAPADETIIGIIDQIHIPGRADK